MLALGHRAVEGSQTSLPLMLPKPGHTGEKDVEGSREGLRVYVVRGLMRFAFRVSGPGAFRVSRFGAWCVSRFAFRGLVRFAFRVSHGPCETLPGVEVDTVYINSIVILVVEKASLGGVAFCCILLFWA